MAERRCKECGKPLVRKVRESSLNFGRRVYCSWGCKQRGAGRQNRRNSLARVAAKSGHCLLCRKRLVPHEKEFASAFAQRRFCDTTCSNRYRAVGGWLRVPRALVAYWTIECGFTVGVPFRYSQGWGLPVDGLGQLSPGSIRQAITCLVDRGVVRRVSQGRNSGGQGRGIPSEYVLLKTRL